MLFAVYDHAHSVDKRLFKSSRRRHLNRFASRATSATAVFLKLLADLSCGVG